MPYLPIMALHPAKVVVSGFWRMKTLLTCALLENHCISYISFCHPEDPVATFWTMCITKSQLSRILLRALQELLLLLKNAAVVQLDHVLTSWVSLVYEKTDTGLHTHTYHSMEGHAPGECSNIKTNWTSQAGSVDPGRDCMHCMWIKRYAA